jgi:hypothetical protein
LGLVFFAAVALVKPIGVSTQFVVLDGILWDAADPNVVVPSEEAKHGYASPNAYLDKSGGKYAAEIANPLNYSFILVIAMMAGAAISAILRGGVPTSDRAMPRSGAPISVMRRGSATLRRSAPGSWFSMGRGSPADAPRVI